MLRVVKVFVLGLLLAATAGCAARPPEGAAPLAYAEERPVTLRQLEDTVSPGRSLAGRTIQVARPADIRLGPKEVVLTFDDGPVPGKTQAVLDILDRHGVKATFFMVGQMAQARPELVRAVAARGHTIGSHTFSHRNLRALDYRAATAEIERGRASVAGALGPSRRRAAPFFRFPYLADTPALRAHLAGEGVVPFGSNIDTKDYFQSSSGQLRARAIATVAARGSGIVLMHDIHARTVAMLPGFLDDLKARGYRVVHIVPGRAGGPELLARAD